MRRGAKACDKECQKAFRRAFLLDRKERYRKAAGLPVSTKSNSGQRRGRVGGRAPESHSQDRQGHIKVSRSLREALPCGTA